jgi:glycerophosphoryl diester phosphodiesterase
MIVLSHRGYWNGSRAKNSLEAFEHSFDLGFGTETDFRDLNGSLVISHDPPDTQALSAESMFRTLSERDATLPLAVNIKSDGLQSLLKKALTEHGIGNYFLFDMSVPDAVASMRAGLRVFTRQSDLERTPSFYAQSAGVWMDAFYEDSWLTPSVIEEHLNAGKEVCLVSPELHGKPHLTFWERLRESPIAKHPSLMICSDIPEDALSYFNS